MSEKQKESKKSKKKGNESRFCTFYLGESRLNAGDLFSLESAHGFVLRNSNLQPRYLKKRKCHLHCDETLGVRVQKSGRFRSSDIVPFVIKYNQLQRMYLFKQYPELVVLGAVGENDSPNRMLIFRFKTVEEANAFCDLMEQRKNSLIPSSSSPIPFILTQDEPMIERVTPMESSSPTSPKEFQIDVGKQQTPPRSPSEQNVEYQSSPTRRPEHENELVDSTAFIAIQSDREMQEHPYDEEEHMALSRYEEVLNGFEKSPRDAVSPETPKSTTVEVTPTNVNDLYATHSLPQRRVSNPTPTEAVRISKPKKSPRYATASLGRPRTRQELPPMLFRESQRHKIMYEDIHYLNYGPEGYYETKDGPIFFYVAHMKPETIQEEHSAIEEVSNMKKVSHQKEHREQRDLYSSTLRDTYATTESKRRPYYQTTTTRFVESGNEDHFTSSNVKENYRSNVETRYNLPEWNLCEMEVKLDLDSEGDDLNGPYYSNMQTSPQHSEGAYYDSSTRQQRFVTKTRLHHY